MQADPQPRHGSGARDGVGGGRTRDHQARGGQHAIPVRRLDCLVDLRREPEIVRGDDQPFHALPSWTISPERYSEMNWVCID